MSASKPSNMLVNGRVEEPFNRRIDSLEQVPQSTSSMSQPEVPTSLDVQPRDNVLSALANDVTIGPGTILTGEIHDCSKCDLHGQLEGSVTATEFVVHRDARFNGIAHAREAHVYGIVDGDLVIRDHLSIHATGSVNGNVTYSQLVVETGAQLVGTTSRKEAAEFDEQT